MTNRVGEQLGHYRLVQLLGHGSFAEVYLGEHIYLETQAAIKILNMRLISDEVETFHSEARIIAHLEHSNIVRVLDFGLEEHTPFLVMSYAPNGTLRQQHPKGTRMSPTNVLPYVKQVAAALQYAHNEKLIHRDVKPENMLLGRNKEVLLSDFGLAVVAYSSSHEHQRDASGTIAYMAPEQARGQPRPASDQYALGVVVYEWLCGERPFSGSYLEVASQHVLAAPPPLCQRVPGLPTAIEEVVLKALAKDPRERFACVQDFANAFEQACLSGVFTAQPPLAQPAPQSAVVSSGQESSSSTQRVSSDMVYALAWSPDRRRLALGGHDRTVQVRDTTTGMTVFTYHGHAGGVTTLAWSPNGQRIASASLDKTIQVWCAAQSTSASQEVAIGHKISSYDGHAGMVYALAWAPDGKYIASASGGGTDNTVHVWEAATGRKVFLYRGHSYWARAIGWAPDGKRIASGSWREVHIWDSAHGQKISTYRGHDGWIRTLAWAPDGKYIASASEDKTVQVWDADKNRLLYTYHGHATWVRTVVWSPDGKRIASASKDHSVQVWDAATGSNVLTYQAHPSSAHAVVWLPNGKHIASANSDGAVQVWQVG